MTTNHANPRKARTPKQLLQDRPRNELRFSFEIALPDAEGADGPQRIDVDLRLMSMTERDLVKLALAKGAQPPDEFRVILTHAWVVWRRTHPHSSLQTWMDGITFGDVLDGIGDFDVTKTAWDTTPETYDPKA